MATAALTHQIIGSAMEVHRVLGPGFIESVYQRALLHELALRGLSTQTEQQIEVLYKGQLVGKHRLDVVVSDFVVVELKAVGEIGDVHVAQALSYLKASGLQLALILNFGEASLTWKRVVKSATFAAL